METNNPLLPIHETIDALAKFEQGKLSRRVALRKLGLTTGFALFGMLAVDDLARVAVKKLAEHRETQAIADSIAHDFKDMGVAFADDGGDAYYDGPPCTPKPDNTDWCAADGHHKQRSNPCHDCYTHFNNTVNYVCLPLGLANDPAYYTCENNANYDLGHCVIAHCEG